jgi:hypothetical protein
VDGAGSSAVLAIQQIAREKKRIFLMSTPFLTIPKSAACLMQFCRSVPNRRAGLFQGVVDPYQLQGLIPDRSDWVRLIAG